MSHIGKLPSLQPWRPTHRNSVSVILGMCCAGMLFLTAMLLMAAVAVPFEGDVLTDLVRTPG